MWVMGYKQSQGDYTLFIKDLEIGVVTTLVVYVDNIIVTRTDEKKRHAAKRFD